jgi:L-alanine-DL-glutamate epimerase-like enolase superfamily enzyme
MSRIARVEITVYGYETGQFSNDAEAGGGRGDARSFAIAIETEDGARGEYCAMHIGKRPIALAQTLMVAPLLPGREASAREGIFNDLKLILRHYGGIGVAAIDICLWDLAGKRYGAPIAELLGAHRTRLPAYASTLPASRATGLASPEAFADFAEHCRGLGYPGFKIHGFGDGDAKKEIAILEAVAARIGPGMALMLDSSSTLRTFADALRVGHACDAAGCTWYEDPFADGSVSFHAHADLRRRLRTPLLIGEHIRGLEPKADALVAGATDFVRADPEYDLGITGCMKTAHMAESFGRDLEIHACGPAHRHCMAAMRNSNFYELSLVGPIGRNPIPPVYACGYSDELDAVGADGCFPVPTGPGLGVTYDWDYIEDRTVERHEFR